jgi:hypothetical protein
MGQVGCFDHFYKSGNLTMGNLTVIFLQNTTAAERQDPDFLISPRNKKTGKKRSTIKILYPPVQIAS